MVRVGIIGGSGIYDPSMFDHVKEQPLQTPFGMPSDSFYNGRDRRRRSRIFIPARALS